MRSFSFRLYFRTGQYNLTKLRKELFMKIWQNIENGNILESYSEVLKEARELYDYNDETNAIPLSEYYQVIEL